MRLITALALSIAFAPLAARADSPPAAPVATASAPVSREEAVQIIQSVAAAADSNKASLPAGRDRLNALIANPGFAALDAPVRRGAWLILALIDLDLQDARGAYEAVKVSSGLDGADATDWGIRFLLAAGFNAWDDATTSLTRLAQDWPSKLAGVQDASILRTVAKARTVSAEKELALFSALDTAGWKPHDPFAGSSGVWLRYAEALLASGDAINAAVMVRRVDDPDDMIRLRIDRRFDRFVQPDPDRYDVRKAAEAELEHWRAAAAAHPDQALGALLSAAALRRLGREEEALAVLDAALARAAPAGGRPEGAAFADWNEQARWLHGERGYDLIHLGRVEEGLTALRRAAAVSESGAPNVSNTINLGQALVLQGRGRAALEVLAKVPPKGVSDYGALELGLARACAYAQSGDSASARREIAAMAARESVHPDAVLSARLCAGDLDAAAAGLIRQLSDPDQAPAALMSLQVFAAPKASPPYYAEIQRRLAALRARPDVQAAVDKVGRVETFDILSPDT